jgi:hypothetical protein
MLRKWEPRWPCRGNGLRAHRLGNVLFSPDGFKFFELKLQLLDLLHELLALMTKKHALEFIGQQLEVRDLTVARSQLLMLADDKSLHRFEIESIEIGKPGAKHARSTPSSSIAVTHESPMNTG